MLKAKDLARTLSVSLLALVISGCATTGGGPLSGAVKFNDFTDDIRVTDTLTLSVKDAMDHYGVNGVTVVGIDNGAIVNFEFHGVEDHITQTTTDENTVYQAASLSKMIAGLGMAQADRTNLISLDTDVAEHVVQHLGESVFSWHLREFTTTTGKRWAEDITIRRLLQSTAGLDRPTTGTGCAASETSISRFLGSLGAPCTKCVTCESEPGTQWSYSSGGFVVAEAMFEEESGRTARNYLNNDVLEPYGFTKSTFKNAGNNISNLATGCDTTIATTQLCKCHHEIAKVKFPGGMLANPLEYARFLILLADDGEDYAGNQIINLSDIREVIHPAYHKDSSLHACTINTNCLTDETCIAGRCMQPLGSGSNWYGMGVHMKTRLADDGYPRELYHSGGQPGFSSYFNLDRVTNDGVVVFINNAPGAGKNARQDFLDAIIAAFKRHYR